MAPRTGSDAQGDPDAGRPRGAWRLLGNRRFAAYWLGGLVSGPGTWLHNVTASVLVLELTGSPFMVGVVNFATFIPLLLFSLPAGVLGDRVDRRLVVGVACTVAGATAGTLAWVAAAERLSAGLLIGFCFLLGTAQAVNKPAHGALLPTLVSRAELPRATALNVLQFQFGQVAGPGLASLLLLVGTPAQAFALNAVSFLGPVVSMAFVGPRRRRGGSTDAAAPPTARAPARAPSISEGLRVIMDSPVMPAMVLAVVLTNGAVEALRTLAPTIAAGRALPEAAGVIIMGYSVGALLGLVGFGTVERRLAPAWLLPTAFALQVVGLVGVAAAPSLAATVVAAAPIGLGFALSTPLLSAGLQTLAREDHRSRVMAVFSMAHLGMRPFFALAAGGLATVSGAPPTLLAFAVLALAAAVYTRRRRLQRPPD
ncbi:MFS transporter [Actinotalea sp. Marseille-Q4924]|uniref:MFS transporter n=1 Tax=Actinotalea sp. Marseille-Q4924 TaxID=2866571 RepID=UPI001CE44439|nr:MFS transporter [Actinotalea sp. Marseille-Q4924]